MRVWNAFYAKVSDPKFAQRAHGVLTILWFIAAFPVCIFLASSIPFLVFVSVYAVVSGHWSAWQAARTEVLQSAADKRIYHAYYKLRKLDPDDPKQ